MPRRSKIATLPAEVRKWLEKALADKGYAGYELLEAELKRLGYQISRSSIQRFGSDLERRLSATKAATEAAVALNSAAPDDEAQLSGAVLSMIQTDVFNIILKLREADDADPVKRAKLLSAVAKDMATAGRAQVDLKRFQSEVRAKLKSAADAVAKIASKGGLTKAAVNEIRNQILGVST